MVSFEFILPIFWILLVTIYLSFRCFPFMFTIISVNPQRLWVSSSTPSIFCSAFSTWCSAPISVFKRIYAVGIFLNKLLSFWVRWLDSEVRRVFLVHGEHKKAHCVSKPLYPTYKKFSASVHRDRSYCVATSMAYYCGFARLLSFSHHFRRTGMLT